MPGVSPNEVQRALDAGAGAGGVSLPRSAENAANRVQLQQAPTTGNVELLMKFLHTENEPVKIYGWLENSYTQNTNGRPHNDSNFSVFPNRGANQWQGNQYYFIVENPLESNVDHVNLGFRVDTLVGNDWQFSKSYGLFDRAFRDNTFGGVDLPQMYGSIHLPILTPLGMDVIGGRFYSPAGFESVMPVKRPLLSIPYLFNFTPFTLFGTETILHLNERVNLINGAVNGWDRWIDSSYRLQLPGRHQLYLARHQDIVQLGDPDRSRSTTPICAGELAVPSDGRGDQQRPPGSNQSVLRQEQPDLYVECCHTFMVIEVDAKPWKSSSSMKTSYRVWGRVGQPT